MVIPLKLKYRNPAARRQHHQKGEPEGLVTLVYNAGKYTSKVSNSGKAQKAKQGTGHRRSQGLGYTSKAGW